MPKPGSEQDESIDDGMFDFLSEDAANRPARPADAGRRTNPPAARQDAASADDTVDDRAEWEKPLPSRRSKPLPIIRKPVPVSESGPNVSPFERAAAGAKPKNQPSALAQRVRPTIQPEVDDSFDFLSEEPLVKRQGAVDFGEPIRPRGTPENATDFGSDWNEGVHEYYDDDEDERPRRRTGWIALGALAVMGVGLGAAWQTGLLDEPLSRFTANTQADGTNEDLATASQPTTGNVDLSGSSLSPDTSGNDAIAVAPLTPVAPTNTVAQQFREALTNIEALMAAGDLSGAERALDELDPRVLGYGNPEFSAIRQQIANGNTSTEAAALAEQERAAEAQRLAEEAVRAEQQRIEAEAQAEAQARVQARLQAQLEAERQAEIEAQRAAQLQAERDAQIAAEEAARAAERQRIVEAREAERLRQQAEADRIAAEQAEAERLAAEALAQQQAAAQAAAEQAAAARAAEQRAAEQAAAARAEALAQEQRAAEQRAAEQAAAARAEALAQEQRAAEQRAAEQAAAARAEALAQEQRAAALAAEREAQLQAEAERLERERLEAIAAEQRAAARQAAAERAAQASAQSAGQSSSAANRASSAATENSNAGADDDSNRLTVGAYPITDADFNAMYKRFITVKSAIESRDINAVTQLAQTNGARVQALLQLFSNSESISAKIDNVSTRNSTGMIVGTLTINQVTRRGGVVTQPPANLKTFTLTSRRDAAGWSKIQW